MLKLELDLLPQARGHDVAVVIDVLRMTTTAAALFRQGLAELAIVANVAEARALAAAEGALLVGERGGRKLPGFDGGNSPLEYGGVDLNGKRAVMSTSNGARAVEAAAEVRHLLLGAIVNAAAVADRALALAHTGVSLICAGTAGRVSLDDTLGAACLARELLAREPGMAVGDSVKLALKLLEGTPDLGAGLAEAAHAVRLNQLGFTHDIAFAANLNGLPVVPQRCSEQPARFVGACR